MWRERRRLWLVLGLLLAACASRLAWRRSPTEVCHAVINGACVVVTEQVPARTRPLVLARLPEAFRRAAAYWGSGEDALNGWTVVVYGYWPLSMGTLWVWGSTWYNSRSIHYALRYPTCPEEVFVHEWGHAASYAAGEDGRAHGPDEDPRFDPDRTRSEALAGLPGCEP